MKLKYLLFGILIPVMANGSELLPCSERVEILALGGSDEGRYIEICKYQEDEFEFQALSYAEDVSNKKCSLTGTAKARESIYVYSNGVCEITFTPNPDGVYVAFSHDCSQENCENGQGWTSGEYGGEYTYPLRFGKKERPFLAPYRIDNGEFPPNSGTGWLELRESNEGWGLYKTGVNSGAIGADSGNLDYDIKIRSSLKSPVGMFKMPRLISGPVLSAKIPDALKNPNVSSTTVGPVEYDVEFLGKQYRFFIGKDNSWPGANKPTFSVLSEYGHSYSGFERDWRNDHRIVWAGDLNKDNILDLILDELFSSRCLYLSDESSKSFFTNPICDGPSY